MEMLKVDNKFLEKLLPEKVREHMQCDVKSLTFIGGGSFGKVFKAELTDGRIIAVKAFRVQGSQLEEASQLKTLSENTSVPMPEVLFTHKSEDCAVMAMGFIDGSNVLNPIFLFKSKDKKLKFAQSVVEGMLEWHSVTAEKFGSLETPLYDTWKEYYKKEKQEPWLKALTELSEKGKYSKKSLELLKKATEIYNALPTEESIPVLIHGDLNIMNIMADKKTLSLTGFIDPCGSIWADREYDLFQLRNMWGDSFYLYDTYK
ncbi:MAG: fructosamine kinase family protein, partial [Clostridia bacterium]|nr:fructosamine kinase family protein [Clostridia bacterium]